MRWGWKVALLTPLIPVAALPAFAGWLQLTYYDEFNEINERLSAIPGVRVEHMGGNEDFLLYENLFAELDVTGKGRLEFANLTFSSYDGGGGLQVRHVGGFEPRISGCDDAGVVRMSDQKPVPARFWKHGLDVGPSGDFAPDLSGGIEGVEDAVRRFDELTRLLASWPVCPASAYRKTPRGWYRYCAQRMAPEVSNRGVYSWPDEAAPGRELADDPCTKEPKPRR